MAFMNQEKKAKLAPGINAVLKKYGVKGTISVKNYSCLNVTLRSGTLDLEKELTYYGRRNGAEISHYWLSERVLPEHLVFFTELYAAMMVGNHDRSDSQTDYYDIGWYTHVYIGDYNKPYICTKSALAV